MLCHFKRGFGKSRFALLGYSNKPGKEVMRVEIKLDLEMFAFDSSSLLSIDLLASDAHEALFTYFESFSLKVTKQIY